ncbi:alpha-(1,3)-fucosyltransferase 4-like [Clavelina lepadiformis]|uniref:alpha-(1,3)-fucosyltransferase 4-like n=1 Tax=Clavelina lepadiformis TaxID=159417 RepID=UPI0040410C00
MPWKYYRDPEQIFVFFSHESPSYVINVEHRQTLKKFENHFINWTMTYRTDSDVFAPYGQSQFVQKILKEGKKWVDRHLEKKKKVALWVVSNCDAVRGSKMRMKYSDALVEAGLPVDRFGKCFNNKNDFNELSADDLDAYKFYLSFENAQYCKDYMTEKFWHNAIACGRVPVVWGPSKEDVEKLAPTGSFIHTDDFKTPADLAKYLLYLDSNDTAYKEYFKWVLEPDKKTLVLGDVLEQTGPKRLCKMMLSNNYKKSYHSVSKFYYDEGNACTSCNSNHVSFPHFYFCITLVLFLVLMVFLSTVFKSKFFFGNPGFWHRE